MHKLSYLPTQQVYLSLFKILQNIQKMIQRIQSVYLLIVAVLFTILIFMPSLGVIPCKCDLNCSIFLQSNFLFFLRIIIVAVSILSIFLYKKRKVQIRLTIFSIILISIYYVPLILYISPETFFHFIIPIALPFIGIIFSFLALRAIKKDEALIRSLDRIR